MKSLLRAFGVFAVVVLAAVLVAACGGGDDSSSSSAETTTATGSETSEEGGSGEDVKIDVGTGTLEYPAGTEPKIGMFASSGAAYQEVAREAAQAMADKFGYSITFYDSKFDPATQLNQLQNAISGGEYNAWIVESDAGKILCSTIKKAGEENIAVVQVTNFTCDQTEKPAGEESWTPGTLASVGGSTTITYAEAFAKKVKESIPADAQVGVITGPATVPTTNELKTSLEQEGIKPVEEVNTGYLTPEGLKAAQNMLQSHPDVNVIITIYTELTVGAVRAIEAAGKEGEIEVYDLGGSEVNVKLIEEGKQTMSAPYFPAGVSNAAVEAIHKAFTGEPVERFYSGFTQGTPEEPFFLEKSTLGDFNAEY